MTDEYNYAQNLGLAVAAFAGWLALVVWLAWDDVHCKCCSKRLPKERRP